MAVSGGLPFRIVSVGLEGESALVPEPVYDDEQEKQGILKTEGWKEVITTSTLPHGAASLPKGTPSSRKELEDRYTRRPCDDFDSLHCTVVGRGTASSKGGCNDKAAIHTRLQYTSS